METDKQVSRLLNELKKVQTVSSTLSILHQVKSLLSSHSKLSKSCHANLTQTVGHLVESDHPFIAREAGILLASVDAPFEWPSSLTQLTVRRLQYLRLRLQFVSQVPISHFVRCVESITPATPVPVLLEFLALVSEAAECAGHSLAFAVAAPLVKHVFSPFAHSQSALVPILAELATHSPLACFLLAHGNPKFEELPFPIVTAVVESLAKLGVFDEKISTDVLVQLLKRCLAALVKAEGSAISALALLQALMRTGVVSARLTAAETRQIIATIAAICRKFAAQRGDVAQTARSLLQLFTIDTAAEKISVCPVTLLEPPKKKVCRLGFARTEKSVISEQLTVPQSVADKTEQATEERDDVQSVLSLQLDSPSDVDA